MGFSLDTPGKVIVTKSTMKTVAAVCPAMCKDMGKKLTLVIFWAAWCGHCQKFQPDMHYIDHLIQQDPELNSAVTYIRVEDKSVKGITAKCPALGKVRVAAWPTVALLAPGGEPTIINTHDAHDIHAILKDAVMRSKKKSNTK